MNSDERLMHAVFAADETPEQAEARVREVGARKALNAAADVIGHVRMLTLNVDGRTEAGIELRVESTPLHTEKVDAADEAFAQIVDWVTFWAAALGEELPSTARVWRARAEHVGFPAGTTERGARMLVRLQSLWLLTRLERIANSWEEADAARVFLDDIRTIVFTLRAHYPTSPRPQRLVHPRPCPGCGEAAVHAEWSSADVLDVVIACEVCEYRIENPTAKEIAMWIVDDRELVRMSEECAGSAHSKCVSVHCACECHLPDDVEVGRGEPVPVRRAGRLVGMPPSGTGGDQRACTSCWLIHPAGACQ